MKYEIKRFNDIDAVVILDKEPKINDWYNSDLGINKLGSTTRYVEKYRHKVIATISPFKIEGLPMLELPNQEEDVEKHKRCIETVDKIMSLFPNTELTPLTMAFHAGAAQKLYSEEDMRNVIKLAVYSINPMLLGTDIFTKEENRVIQSLQKKQFPIAVELTEDLKVIKWYYE